MRQPFRGYPKPPPKPDAQTLAWIAYLDVDLDAAQVALRRPAAERGWPGGLEPADSAYQDTEDISGFEPPPAAPTGPRPSSLVAPEGQSLRGAYARRARNT